MKGKLLLILSIAWCLITNLNASAQNDSFTVKGTVTSVNDQTPIPGVSVKLKGSNIGTLTDGNGTYAIKLPNPKGILVFTNIGSQPQEIEINNRATINIALQDDIAGLDEVVVVGYGEQSRRSVTSAVSKLSGDAFREIPITSVSEGIKGKIAGVRVTSNNNSPGAEATIRIRGGSSINNSNAPLILVDGVERSFEGINPNDIASMEVLKDAASSAIYGARASNGVILVTTKKGGYNKAPQVSFESNFAYQNLESKIDFLNAEDYINILRPAIAFSRNPSWNFDAGYSASVGNDANSIYSTRYYTPGDRVPRGWKTMTDPIDNSKMLMFQDNDFQDLMYNSALWQNYYIGLDGGSEKIRYAASIGYTGDEGVAISTGYRRLNIKTNTDAKITDKLTVTVGMDYSQSATDDYPNQRDIISRGLSSPPTQFVYMKDGSPAPGYNATALNPLFYDYITERSNTGNFLTLLGGLNYKLLPGLSADVKASYFDNTNKASSFTKANIFSSARAATASNATTYRARVDGYLNYTKSFKDTHNLSAVAGYSYQKRHYEYLGAGAEGGSSDKIPTLNASPTKTQATTTEDQDVLVGFFGRFSYDYLQKYLFTATMRQDASSKFTDQSRWGFFPGVSAGWIISEEPFMKDIKALSFLKMRTSYGQTGNNAIGVYDALGQFNASYKYDGNAGIRQTVMANRSLTWETTTQLDLGLEAGFLNNRIHFSTDYFDKNTHNLLFDTPLPNTTGFSSVQTNVGKVKYYGFEFELTSKNIQKKNFSWESRLVYSLTKNRILELPKNNLDRNRIGGIALGDGTYYGGIAEGEPLYRFFGYSVAGILQNDQQAASAYYDDLARGYNPADGTTIKGRKFAGDYEWKDRNGDGRITSADRYELGVSVAPISGGLNNNFRFKNFSLNLYVDWALGHSIFDESYQRYFYSTFSTNYALAEDVKKAWKQEGDNTKYAKFTANDSGAGNDNYNRMSDAFTYKGDYLCIREVTLQYDIADQITKKIGVKGITLTLSGNNLHYFTAVQGISPEGGAASTYATDYYNYPPIRRVSFGARVKF